MKALYNDNDPKACAWLRELIRNGLIAEGTVDERSILEITPEELEGVRRFHAFAGIGGWDLALRLAGWPDDREVWTASCPCQPFSDAGARRGVRDERNLWPAVLSLLAERRPATVFGEQVASRAGREWLARVRADLEGIGYAFGAADLCAAGVGAPHIRQRLFWVADASGERQQQHSELNGGTLERIDGARGNDAGGRGAALGLADTQEHRAPDHEPAGESDAERNGGTGRLDHAPRRRDRSASVGGSDREGEGTGRLRGAGGSVPSCGLEHALRPGLQGHAGHGNDGDEPGRLGTLARRSAPAAGAHSPWADFHIAWCRDPNGGDPIPRRIEPDTFPLAHGVPARVGRLRGYGNAINPFVAAVFVKAFVESQSST